MVKSQFNYTMVFLSMDGNEIARLALPDGLIDWEPAGEWCRLQAVRQGRLSPDELAGPTEVRPLWHEQLGRPFVTGFEVTVPEHGETRTTSLPLTYLKSLAEREYSGLKASATSASGERFLFSVLAEPGADNSDRPAAGAFKLEAVAAPLLVHDCRLAGFLGRSAPCEPERNGDHFPAFIRQSVLDEIIDEAGRVDELEAGGFLVGRIWRDGLVPDIFLEVTGQVLAEHTQASTTRLTFTADTWTAAQQALKRRSKDEIVVGWWHCHNYLKGTCKDCKKSRDGSCRATAVFMSTDDVALHRLCFPRAFTIALVVGHSPCSGPSWGLFGWNKGVVERRGAYILNDLNRSSSTLSHQKTTATED